MYERCRFCSSVFTFQGSAGGLILSHKIVHDPKFLKYFSYIKSGKEEEKTVLFKQWRKLEPPSFLTTNELR